VFRLTSGLPNASADPEPHDEDPGRVHEYGAGIPPAREYRLDFEDRPVRGREGHRDVEGHRLARRNHERPHDATVHSHLGHLGRGEPVLDVDPEGRMSDRGVPDEIPDDAANGQEEDRSNREEGDEAVSSRGARRSRGRRRGGLHA